jgi:adenylate cyclase
VVVEADRIILRDDRGLERVLRLDRDGRFLVPWTFRYNHRGLQRTRLVDALAEQETTATWPGWNRAPWKDRVVLVYSTASGSNVSDVGPTPFSAFDHHGIALLNIANAVLTGVSIRRLPSGAEVAIVLLMALAAAGLSWRLRAMWATAAVMVLGAAYLGLSVWLFGARQLWLPCVWPLLGALLTTHVLMIVYRILVEWTEAPVRTAFGRVVSTNVVDLLVRQATRNFVGTRRTVTVVFADIRGFTALAEVAHRRASESVNAGGLEGWEADAVVDAEARETLETVNVYLNTVADVFKAHGGTLDKYIGDCLTAFWGAPLSIREHAVRAVRATILALEAVQVLNESRRAENERRTRDNTVRSAEGHGNLPLAPILEIGIGVNTGPVLVGFMGAKRHIWNYSIFGREVIITSRLERLAGHDDRAPILVSGSTHAELRRLDPELAARFRLVGPVRIRGIQEPIEVHELA